VLTIHDVSYHMHPEWYPYRRDALRRFFYRQSAHAASRILTVSHFSAGEIVRAYGIDPTRIAVAPLGVTPELMGHAHGSLPDGVRPPFVLHVGDIHARRNLPVALAAVCALWRRGGPQISLVLAGVDRGVGDELRALAQREQAPDALVLTGPVSETQLQALYIGAVALVYPSRYEGFGLPLIEAMAAGLPVLGAQAASIPEVVGEAGVLLDPLEPDAWADAIRRVATDVAFADQLRAQGRARAALFTWARTASITLDVYRDAVAR
jgi:glycosyltransferase involved in cell wall biosynthesis